jgi:formylglycine-generating enzyme
MLLYLCLMKVVILCSILFLFGCNTKKQETLIIANCFPVFEGSEMYFNSNINNIKQRKDTSTKNMVQIPAGDFLMGAQQNAGYPEEHPQHQVTVHSFWIDETEVTNEAFEQFITETKYITTAERKPNWDLLKLQLPPDTPRPADSLLIPGGLVFTATKNPVKLNDANQWWQFVAGANWRHPDGPNSNIIGKEKYPVVQISWEDAMAFCQWNGKRLPTEAEWEWASKAGVSNALYSWGNDTLSNAFFPANIWQGNFPYQNNMADSFYNTAPAKSFTANKYGLFNMSGNVWEWCIDWMDSEYYKTVADKISVNPTGFKDGIKSTHPYQKVLKGGSYLCNESYCSGYRVARRSSSTWDTGSNHIGFRCVKN